MGSGRVSLPVAPSAVIYSNFRHVSGSPAPEGSATLSIDRLKILDILIDRLSSVKSEPLAAAEAPSDLSAGRVDALIQQYSSEIHSRAAAPALPYSPPMAVEPGMLFSFAA
jgi:hypothetical protein